MTPSDVFYYSRTNGTSGPQPSGWERAVTTFQIFGAIISFAIVMAPIVLSLIWRPKYISDGYYSLFIVALMITASLLCAIVYFWLKVFEVTITAKGIEGDFIMSGGVLRMRRLTAKRFFRWNEIASIYFADFKRIIVLIDSTEHFTWVEDVSVFAAALKKAGHSELVDLKKTERLFGAVAVSGWGLLGMMQSSKKSKDLFDRLRDILK